MHKQEHYTDAGLKNLTAVKKLFLLKPEQLAYRLLILFPLLGMQPNLSSQTLNEDWWVPNGTVNTMLCDSASNTLYLGGSFSYLGPNVPYAAQLDPVTGAPDLPFAKPNGAINTAIPDGNGGWYIGGEFTSVQGQTRNRLARINADGSLHPWNPDANGTVNSLHMNHGVVYVGGSFTSIAGEEISNIAVVEPESGALLNWTEYSTNGAITTITSDENSIYVGGGFDYFGYYEPYGAVLNTTSGLRAFDIGNPNDVVDVAVPDGNGGWYIGGQFTSIGGVERNRIARINSDGSLHTWNPGCNGYVYAIAVSGNNVYVGGTFTNIGGQNRNRIAAISATTGLATAWNPNANSTVEALLINGSTIYVGGSFTNIGGSNRNRIAALSTSTGNATSWNPNANAEVLCLAISGSTLYAGGFFTTIGGQSRYYIAALSTSTGSATAWNPSADDFVNTIKINGSTLYAGGAFYNIGGQTRNYIAALSTSTGSATSWNPYAGGWVKTILINGTTIYAVGSFYTIGGQTRNGIAALNNTTGTALSWNPLPLPDPYGIYFVKTLAISGSSMFIGGDFSHVNGQGRNKIAALSRATGSLTTWNPNANNWVGSLLINGSTIYVGGSFTNIGGSNRNRIAALSTSTGNATSWNPNSNGIVHSLAINGSNLYAGGEFTTIGGQTRNYIAALNTTTGLATSWNPNANGPVRTTLVNGNSVFAGGDFTSIGGQTRNYLSELDATTGNATAWDPNPSGQVYTLHYSGNKIFAGGNFTSIGGVYRICLAAIDMNTGMPTNWNPNANSWVLSMVKEGSILYLGGYFTNVGGQTRNRIAAVDMNTGLATAWNSNANGDVRSLVIHENNVYAGGNFTTIGGQTRNRIAALDKTTGLATSWNPGANSSIYTMAKSGNTLYLGGNFTQFGGVNRDRLVAVNLLDGTTASWNPGANGWVYSLKPAGNIIYTGGSFTNAGGQARDRLAAIDALSGIPTSWNPPSFGTGSPIVKTIEVLGNAVLIGGDFNSVGGETRQNFAALDMTTAGLLPWNSQFNDPDEFSNPEILNICISGNRIFVGGGFDYINSLRQPYLGSFTLSETLWQGNLSQDFNHPQNWSFGKADRFPNARIPAGVSNYPHINNDPAQPAISNNLTIDNGATLTIDPGKALTVNGTLNNYGDLVVESDSTGTGSLITHGLIVNTGNTQVEKFITHSNWHLISSPVTEATAAMFTGNYLQKFNEPVNNWQDITEVTTLLSPGKGFGLWSLDSSIVYNFNGTPNTGEQETPFTRNGNGYNLLGNPYPSAISWDLVDLPSGLNGQFYLWDPEIGSGGDYVYYIEGGGAANTTSGYIPAGQGFFVEANADGDFTLNNNSRVHSIQPFYKETTALPIVVLKATANGITTQTAVRFAEEATAGVDRMLDVRKLPSGSQDVPAVYTMADGAKMSINTLPGIDGNEIVPVGFEVGMDGEYRLTLSELNTLPADVHVILEDNVTHLKQDMRVNPEYTFTYQAGSSRDFLLHFRKTNGLIDENGNSQNPVACYFSDNTLNVKFNEQAFSGKEAKANLSIYSVNGQLLYSAGLSGLSHSIPLNASSAVYLVKIVTSSGVYITKVNKQ